MMPFSDKIHVPVLKYIRFPTLLYNIFKLNYITKFGNLSAAYSHAEVYRMDRCPKAKRCHTVAFLTEWRVPGLSGPFRFGIPGR
jgi:hypothetical protein